jgi:hypothetical protein
MTEYEVGREVWICIGKTATIVKGTIVHKFPMYNMTQYVVEIMTHIDPVLEVRNWFTISEDGKNLNIWNRTRN